MHLMAQPRFQTERLIARPWQIEDAEAALSLYGDPEVVRYLGSMKPMVDVTEVRAYLEKVLNRYGPDPTYGMWALVEKDSGEIVGSTLLKPLPEHEEIEVGWHLARRHWGKGYATESAKGALDYGFNDLGLDTIYAVVFAENERSLNVARRLGMKPLGKTSEYYGFELELFKISRNPEPSSVR